MLNPDNMTFEELCAHPEVVKITRKAAFRFVKQLSEDEINTCVMSAIWKANKKWDVRLGSKFSTFLFRGVILECLTQLKFNRNGNHTVPLYGNVMGHTNTLDEVDLMDELSHCDHPSIMRAKFVENKSIKEIAVENKCCGETIRLKIQKDLKKLKARLV